MEKLRKEIVELREMMANMDKKHDDAIKRMEEKFTLEIEGLTNDFDEERKRNAALKVEIDRIKRRNARHDTGTSAWLKRTQDLFIFFFFSAAKVNWY